MPSDWSASLGAEFRGRVLYRRRFGCPTGLGRQDRVTLVVDAVDAFGSVALNGQQLGDVPPGAGSSSFLITDLLQRRNDLQIEVELPELERGVSLPRPGRDKLPGGLIGEVRLEIGTP